MMCGQDVQDRIILNSGDTITCEITLVNDQNIFYNYYKRKTQKSNFVSLNDVESYNWVSLNRVNKAEEQKSLPPVDSYDHAQTNEKNQVDLSCYLFKNKVFRSKKMEGTGVITNGEGIRFGLQYSRLIKNKIWINTGLGFLRARNVYHGAVSNPHEPQFIKTIESYIIQIPIRIRYDMLNWLYLKSGFTIDIQTNNKEGVYLDNQSGIGFTLICGFALKITKSLLFIIEPEVGVTRLNPFHRNKNPQHFLLTGISFNIGYLF